MNCAGPLKRAWKKHLWLADASQVVFFQHTIWYFTLSSLNLLYGT